MDLNRCAIGEQKMRSLSILFVILLQTRRCQFKSL